MMRKCEANPTASDARPRNLPARAKLQITSKERQPGTSGPQPNPARLLHEPGLEKLLTALPRTEYQIEVTILYEDNGARKWAGEVYQNVEAMAGVKAVRGTWWKLSDLVQPGVLAGAVSKAMRSDMIVIAVRGSEGLPLPFYFWVNSWLPHRIAGMGALVALLGKPSPRNRESGRLCKYLRAVARRGRMDLLVAERALENPTPTIPIPSRS